MKRRDLLAALAAKAAALAAFREKAIAAGAPNIRWAVSMFLWTSTQWGDHAPVPFTDMLDVIKDTGFDGFRFIGWPGSLKTYDPEHVAFLNQGDFRSAGSVWRHTLHFNGQADDPTKHALPSTKRPTKRYAFLKPFQGQPKWSYFRPSVRTRCWCGSTCALPASITTGWATYAELWHSRRAAQSLAGSVGREPG